MIADNCDNDDIMPESILVVGIDEIVNEIGANQSSADQDGTDNISGLPIMTSDDTFEVISKSPNSHSNIADDDMPEPIYII